MRLLLDEMLSPHIAHDLRSHNHDVQAVKADRPELEGLPDEELTRHMSRERRGIVTDNVKDFFPIHTQILAAGAEHYGMLFSFEDTLPRSKATFSLWFEALHNFLKNHAAEDSLRNRVHILP